MPIKIILLALSLPFIFERGKRLLKGSLEELPGIALFLLSLWLVSISFPGAIPFSLLLLAFSVIIIIAEATALKFTQQNILRLISLRTTTASLLIKGKTETSTAVEKLKTGDVIQVKPGERIPCDGTIIKGTTRVDETPLTGEEIPLFKTKGDKVLAGTLNQDGIIQIRIEQDPPQHYLERMISEIRRIQQSPPKNQKKLEWAFRILGLITIIAALVRITGASGIPPAESPLLTLALLSPFCFTTWARVWPMIHTIALGSLLKKGILVRSMESLNRLAGVDTLFFDKTGILTKGDYLYSQSFLEWGTNQGIFLSVLFSLETHSHHPLAKAVETHPWYLEVPKFEVKNFKVHPGLGICGAIQERGKREHFVAAGNQRFLRRFQMQISPGMREKVDLLELMGETVILCGWDREVQGLVSFSDDIRPDMKPMLTEVNQMGIKPVLITGDHEEMISHLTHTKGIENAYMRCLPEEKIKKIKKYREDKHKVGYLVTRHDDLTLLKEADAGIVMHSGPHLQSEAVDISIFGAQLIRVAEAFRTARKTYRAIRLSYGMGSLFTITGIALTLLGFTAMISTPLLPFAPLSLNGAAALYSCLLAVRLKKLEQV